MKTQQMMMLMLKTWLYSAEKQRCKALLLDESFIVVTRCVTSAHRVFCFDFFWLYLCFKTCSRTLVFYL